MAVGLLAVDGARVVNTARHAALAELIEHTVAIRHPHHVQMEDGRAILSHCGQQEPWRTSQQLGVALGVGEAGRVSLGQLLEFD